MHLWNRSIVSCPHTARGSDGVRNLEPCPGVVFYCNTFPWGSCNNLGHVQRCLSSVVHIPVCVTVLSRGCIL